MTTPYFVNGYAGAFDRSPAGRSDSLVIAGGHADGASLQFGYGVLGQSSPLSTVPISEGGRGTEYGSIIQDSVDYDFHAVFRTWDDSVQYWRLRPRRTGSGGAITGFEPIAQFSLRGGKFIQYPAIDEVIDGAGRHRLIIFGLNNAGWEAAASMVVGVTAPGAGVDPFSEQDFQGPGGEASFVTVGNVPKPGDNNPAYGSMITLAQHGGSRKIEVLAAAGQHGQTGEMRRVTLTPSGSGWTAGTVHELPKGIGSIFAIAGVNDEVFWQWADANGRRMRISRIDSNGNVIEDGIPSPHDQYEDYRSCHMAIAPDGRLMVIWYFEPGEIRTRVFNPSSWTWGPWKTIRGGTNGIFNYGPMQGLGSYQGRLWSGAVLAVDNAEAIIAAASF